MGVEVHVQMVGAGCRSKIFSPSTADNNEITPNKNISPLDYGLPGALPVTNSSAVKLAVRAALGLKCHIHNLSYFDNKHYFYVDLPCGRQTTQFYHPIATGGYVVLFGEDSEYSRRVLINRIHIEQDAGKSLHDMYPEYTAVDYNRAGIGLLEIVTEPCIKSTKDLELFIKTLRGILRGAGVCECNMERGEMRIDLSISISKNETLGTRVEIKNLNSISSALKSAEYEFRRQKVALESGEQISQETRLFDVKSEETRVMRSKEDAADYMYIPENNLPPLEVTDEFIQEQSRLMPQLPRELCAEITTEYGLKWDDARTIVDEPEYVEFFNQLASSIAHDKMQIAVNWMVVNLFGVLRKLCKKLSEFNHKWLVEIVEMVSAGEISPKTAKELLELAAERDTSPRAMAQAQGLKQVSEDAQIKDAIQAVLDANPVELQRYRDGEVKLMGFFMGQVLKAVDANPKVLTALLKQLLGP
jgi:aspartyl-tRNA(Asn)/glutamyl-tRNA(Gln) amidotransferase subunit B